jgi:Domain of unknown function (DUF4437)
MIIPIYLNDMSGVGTLPTPVNGANTDKGKDARFERAGKRGLAGPDLPGNHNPHYLKEKTTMSMHKKIASLSILGALCAAQPLLAQQPKSSQSLSVPAGQVQYKDLGGPQLGTVWGDSAKGPHGSFLRLPKGFVSPAHLHTGNYYGVIVEGSVSNAEAGQQEVALGPGSYYFQKGKTNHVTKCLGNTDCLIYISQSKAFDFITPKK